MYAGHRFEIIMLSFSAASFAAILFAWLYLSGAGRKTSLLALFLLVIPYCLLSGAVLWNARRQFFTFVTFTSDLLIIRTLFCKTVELPYEQIKECGIGCYFQGRPSGLGSVLVYMFFSEVEFDSSLRTSINKWHPKNCKYAKIAYTKKRFDTIVKTVPKALEAALKNDLYAFRRSGFDG